VGWKIVRDGNEKWCQDRGITGTWRQSADPVSGLLKKIFEEAGEFAEHRDPAELYDLLDVVTELVARLDRAGLYGASHQEKVHRDGLFTQGIEWHPRAGMG
jgi:predicted house-cleaning noncanonical NTP pyrophosphatase (MazG superfamily)